MRSRDLPHQFPADDESADHPPKACIALPSTFNLGDVTAARSDPKRQTTMSIEPNATAEACTLDLAQARAQNETWRALCAFLLTADEPMSFLRAWNEGDFEACRREWPEAPPEVYPGGQALAQVPSAT